MNIEINKEETFSPIKISITLESQEEVDALYMLGWSNNSVPQAVKEAFSLDGDELTLSSLQTLLSLIRNTTREFSNVETPQI